MANCGGDPILEVSYQESFCDVVWRPVKRLQNYNKYQIIMQLS